MHAWLFDRVGALGSENFNVNVNDSPELFLRVVCHYATMGATEVGYDPSIKWQDGQVYDPSIADTMTSPRPYPYMELPIDQEMIDPSSQPVNPPHDDDALFPYNDTHTARRPSTIDKDDRTDVRTPRAQSPVDKQANMSHAYPPHDYDQADNTDKRTPAAISGVNRPADSPRARLPFVDDQVGERTSIPLGPALRSTDKGILPTTAPRSTMARLRIHISVQLVRCPGTNKQTHKHTEVARRTTVPLQLAI